MRIIVALILLGLVGTLVVDTATAGLPSGVLKGISADPHPNARLPLSLPFVDETGVPRTLGEALGQRPAILIFADYTCRTLCGPILQFAIDGLEKSGLKAGSDYRLVVIGLDPKDGPPQAQAMRSARIPSESPVAAATTMLIGNQPGIQQVTEAAGYQYTYDAEHDQFAHPAAVYVITSKGRIARALSGLGLNGNDLRLALVDAGQGRVGTFVDHLRLLCYGFDPALGIYTASIERWLMLVALTTVVIMIVWLALMISASGDKAS